ncbi:MAG: Gfo/Idh/MocA family oxidoreductase [Cyclobacteriaceae bacterium]
MNRRNFTRTLAVGAGASALYSPFSMAVSRSLPPKEKLGIALVGLGGYSTGQLGPALQETENCYLAGVVTGTPEKEKIWADKYGIPEKNIYNYDTFDQIADNDDIDIIYVVLPNSMHAEYTIRAAEAGKHVICEKPMAINAEECQQMIDACEKAGVKLSIGYRLHFEPHNQKIMQMAKEQPMGEINFVRCGAGYRMGDNWDQWRLKKDLAGTGALGNMGVYAIQGALYAVGENPIYVRAQEFKTMPKKFAEVDETVTFQFEFPSGAVANCETSHNASMNYLFVSADQGWAELDPFSPYGGIKGTTSEGAMQLPQVNQQARQMDDFASRIINDEKTPVPGEMGMRDVQILDGILRSIKAGGEKIQLKDLAF